jgi:hypothetical protein
MYRIINLVCFLVTLETFETSVVKEEASQCTSLDLLVWKDNMSFSLYLNKIANKHIALPDPIRRDLKSQYPSLSEPCTECFISNIRCAAVNCFRPCLRNSLSQTCLNCCETYCNPALKICLGVDDANMPLVPDSNLASPATTQPPRPVRVRKPAPSLAPSTSAPSHDTTSI